MQIQELTQALAQAEAQRKETAAMPTIWERWYALGPQTRAALERRHGSIYNAAMRVFGC